MIQNFGSESTGGTCSDFFSGEMVRDHHVHTGLAPQKRLPCKNGDSSTPGDAATRTPNEENFGKVNDPENPPMEGDQESKPTHRFWIQMKGGLMLLAAATVLVLVTGVFSPCTLSRRRLVNAQKMAEVSEILDRDPTDRTGEMLDVAMTYLDQLLIDETIFEKHGFALPDDEDQHEKMADAARCCMLIRKQPTFQSNPAMKRARYLEINLKQKKDLNEQSIVFVFKWIGQKTVAELQEERQQLREANRQQLREIARMKSWMNGYINVITQVADIEDLKQDTKGEFPNVDNEAIQEYILIVEGCLEYKLAGKYNFYCEDSKKSCLQYYDVQEKLKTKMTDEQMKQSWELYKAYNPTHTLKHDVKNWGQFKTRNRIFVERDYVKHTITLTTSHENMPVSKTIEIKHTNPRRVCDLWMNKYVEEYVEELEE